MWPWGAPRNRAYVAMNCSQRRGSIANELRRRSLRRTVNLGEHSPPDYNIDDSHRVVLAENNLDAFTTEDRYEIWWRTAHSLEALPDYPAVLPKLREKLICASFIILSFRIIIDTAKRNNLNWDAVISCEDIGKYKVLPSAYLTAAKWLQLELHFHALWCRWQPA